MYLVERKTSALRVILLFLWTTAIVQEPYLMEAQVTKSWVDVNAASSWEDAVVDVVLPGSRTGPSRVEQVRVKTITFRSSIPPKLFSIMAVPSQNGSDTFFIGGGRFLIADAGGVTAILVNFSTLNVYRSYFTVPATSPASAIARFTAEVTERRVADEFEKYSTVQLGADAPKGFFVKGSQYVDAGLETFAVQDGVLRVDLRSHDGTAGSFWVDLTTLKVTKTKFGG